MVGKSAYWMNAGGGKSDPVVYELKQNMNVTVNILKAIYCFLPRLR